MKIDELNNRLEDEFPNIYNTILINGNWGIGKTHFIKKEFLKYKNPMYLSLFEINSFEEFKIQLPILPEYPPTAEISVPAPDVFSAGNALLLRQGPLLILPHCIPPPKSETG